MKKTGYYGMAFLVFVTTMALLYGGTVALTLVMMTGGVLIRGEAGVDRIYEYLMQNANLFSCLVYLMLAVVFLLWYYFAFVEKRGIKQSVYLHTRKLSPVCFGWIILLGFAVQHATSLLMAGINIVAPSVMQNYVDMVESSGLTQYSLLWAVATLILPPLTEEVIFRGLILQYLGRAGAGFLAANLIQSVLFGIFHMNLVQGIYTALFGFLLGYLAYRYDSVLVPMALHAVYNLFGTALVDLENALLPDFVLGILVLISVPVLAGTIVMIHFGVGEKKQRIKGDGQ